MRLTLIEKLQMCKEHVLEGKSISHVSERYDNYDISNLKYLINLYKQYGEKPFLNRERRTYQRDTKLLAISRVKAGESLRSVALDLELLDPSSIRDWISLLNKKGSEAIKDTYSRKAYLTKAERNKYKVDQALKEENERLRAEIEYLKKSQSLTRNLNNIKSRDKTLIVNELRKDFKLSILLCVTGMASSVYYYHLKCIENDVDKYEEVKEQIDYLYLVKHKKRMGYKRIHIELKKLGYRIGKSKVLQLMKEKGYFRVKKKKWRRYSSYIGEVGRIQPNLMNQNFDTERPYEKAGTDVTMFPLEEESVYLSPIIDFNSREVLSYSVGTNAKMDKIKTMMNDLAENHLEYIKGMMIQSDQGVQYQNSRYREWLDELGIIQSMSGKGNCIDNSPTENFFGRMKEEMWNGHENKYKTSKELIDSIDEYIEYYNSTRIITKHQMSPIDYRNQYIRSIL